MEAATKTGPYQLFMLALCVYVLIGLAVGTLIPIDGATKTIFDAADSVICIIFFGDFLYSLIRAPRKWDYILRWGWIDLLSSIPTMDVLRWGRAARVLRIMRVLRGVRSTKALLSFVLERRAESAFLAAMLASVLLVVFSSLAMLQFETLPESNIKGAEDALWWAVATVTTVGYGDRFPVTSEGRIVATILMTAGVGLFGIFTGFVASWFLASEEAAKEGELDEIRAELRAIREALETR